MELLKEILINVLMKESITISFPNLQINMTEIVEMQCYKTLQKIKTTIDDDSLSDVECFMKIEEIVQAFEHIGVGGGNRHDFG